MTRPLSTLLSISTFALATLGAWPAAASPPPDERPPAASPRLDDGAATPCAHTAFKTAAVKKACAEGGQRAAKQAMKAFVKEVKATLGEKVGCKDCHSELAPDYPLTHDGLKRFEELEARIGAKKKAPTQLSPSEAATLLRFMGVVAR